MANISETFNMLFWFDSNEHISLANMFFSYLLYYFNTKSGELRNMS